MMFPPLKKIVIDDYSLTPVIHFIPAANGISRIIVQYKLL